MFAFNWRKKLFGARRTPPPEPALTPALNASDHALDAARQFSGALPSQQIANIQAEYNKYLQQSLMNAMATPKLLQGLPNSSPFVLNKTVSPLWAKLPTIPKPPHPMQTPPLLVPFAHVPIPASASSANIAMLTPDISSATIDSITYFPENVELTEEYGDMIVTPEVMLHGKHLVVVGIDPMQLAYYMRLFYTAVQYNRKLPRTLEMLQVLGYEKVTAELKELNGVLVPGPITVKHLLFSDKPWCEQFRNVLRAALSQNPGLFAAVNCRDNREVLLKCGTPMPLLEFLGQTDKGSELVTTVRRMGTFWQVGHPVAMDWAAVT